MNIKTDKLLKRTWHSCKFNFKKVVLFEMAYRLLTAIIFMPLIYFIIEKSVKSMGVSHLTNNELTNLIFNIPGIIGLIIVTLLVFILMFIEMCVLTTIASKFHEKKDSSITESLLHSIKILPKTLGIYILPILFTCIIMGPIAGLGLGSSLIKNISIPLFIKVELQRTNIGMMLLIIAIIVSILISLRWMLSIPIIMIEKVTLKEALRKSRILYKKETFNIIKFLLLWIITNLIIRGVPFYIYIFMSNIIIRGMFSLKLYLAIFIIAYILASIITAPFFIIFLVELYYEYRDYNEQEININTENNYYNSKVYMFIQNNKKAISIITVIGFSIMVLSSSFHGIQRSYKDNKVSVTAHRGFNKMAPENSMPAISESVDFGADYVEIDVMTTKDNKVVLFHDSTLKRFDKTNRKIKDMTLEEAKNVDIGASFYDYQSQSYGWFEEIKMPTLEEVFKEFKGKIKFNIELKPYGKEDNLSKEVADLIKEYNMEDEVVISSLDYNSLMKFKDEELNVDVGYIITFGIGDLTKFDVDFISAEYGMISKGLIDKMHNQGKEVHVWTLNKAEEIISAATLGVDNIITDEVWGTIATLGTLGMGKNDMISFDINRWNYVTWFHDNINYILKYVNI